MLTVQEKLSILLWDRRWITIPDDIETPGDIRYILIKDPTLEDKNHFLHIRKLEELYGRREGVPSEGDVFAAARQSGYWTDEDEKVLKEANEHISFLESEVARQKFLARKKTLQKQLHSAREKLSEVSKKENYLKTQTVEYLAHEIAVFDLIQRVVLNKDGVKFWKSEQEFMECKNHYLNFIVFLAGQVLNQGVLETYEFREIARDTEWRLLWTLNRENLTGIFNRPIGELNLNQKLLIYWSRVYDSVYEDPNRPDQSIIDDDERLDDWFANRDLERKSDKKQKPSGHHNENMMMLEGEYIESCNCGAIEHKGKGLGESMPHAQTCPYGTFRRYTREEKDAIANQIYGRNSDRVRQLINKESDDIQRRGLVEEQHLRGKKSRHIIGAQTKVTPIYKR